MLGMTGAAAGAGDEVIKEGSDAGFMADVIEASKETPVIVDFWAPWCGPCRQLTPAIEKAVRDAKGKVKLVKINVDENPMVAGQLQVQSIPMVYAFAGGRPVDGFMGAKSPGELKQFIETLLRSAGTDPQAEQIEAALVAADEALAKGAAAEAAQIYAQVLTADDGSPRAIAGLAKSYAALGDAERAREIIDSLDEETRADPAVQAALAAIALAESAAEAGETAGLKAAIDSDPNDHQSRYEYALALLGQGDKAEAVDQLLELFRRDSEWDDGAARKKLFEMFDAFGPKDPLTSSGRRRLSSMIFS